ncbi:MAG: PQQ-dependent sugar dehydrogenase [Gemmatimonadota bacterium]|nr:PQQ-dependent sugar dehydrogenase [Gemmatimonadota bacterium]
MLSLVAGASAAAQGPPASTVRPGMIPKSGPVPAEPNVEQRLQTDFKVPAGFKVTLFAGPPVAMYPTCVNESPDGAVFVCVDPNLSLSTFKGVGRVMRLVDTDGDGHADKYTTFATMDSPRGVVSDGRAVYVMHPPTLTAYRDTNGDGIADESTDIVTGLGFDLDFRGADHTTNNVEMGPDGWLYIAVGDYGFIKATGTDGKQIQHRGGGVVRVRPDGTNLEIVTVGTRNIYDVSIDPFDRIFARDNTNDGDGWDSRLHYMAPGANLGYPMLYQNFKTEHFPTLHDYGAGAAVGSIWLQDPAWPAGYNNNLITGDWTLQKVYRHTLTPKGTYFDIQQDEFISMMRPSDLALDGNSNLYVTSLAGGTFTYTSSDTVGYVVQVRPPNLVPVREASVFTATDAALLSTLGSPNALHRLHASEELVRRPVTDALVRGLREMIGDASKSADVRATAMYTIKQVQGAKANDILKQVAGSPDARIRETALRMLVDRTDQLEGVSPALYVKALSDADGQVQVQAIRGIVRLGARDAAASLVPLTGSTDQGLAHLAVNALVSLQANDAAMKGIDASPAVRVGVLRALAQMHDPVTVTELIDRLGHTTDAAARMDVLHALGRLYNREGFWKGDWWTTRPAHLGPFFDPAPWEESPRIRSALTGALLASSGSQFSALVNDLVANEVLPRGSEPLLTAVTASRDPLRAQVIEALVGRTQLDEHTLALAAQLDAKGGAVHGAVAQLLAGETTLGAGAMPLARSAVLDASLDPKIRGALLMTMSQVPGPQALDAAAEVFSRLNPAPGMAASASATPPTGRVGRGAGGMASGDPIETAWRRFVSDRRRMNELDYFINMSKTAQPSQRTLAYAVLMQSIRAPRTPPMIREKVAPVIDAAWTDPASAPSLVEAITLMRMESQYAEKLAAYNQGKPR